MDTYSFLHIDEGQFSSITLLVSASLLSARKLLKRRIKSRVCQTKRNRTILTVIQAAKSQSTGTIGKQNCLSVDKTLAESTSRQSCYIFVFVIF